MNKNVARAAYDPPLVVRHLLHAALACAPGREIVFADHHRYDYRTFGERIGRLASGLARIGVGPGQTVAIMDWDSHRYLECFFAVPMMGAVLHTVNVRLSPDQILYTVNHADDDAILVHEDFLPLLDQIRDRFARAPRLVVISESDRPAVPAGFETDYESLLAGGDPAHSFDDLDERTPATTFYTTGTTGDPKGVWYSHRQIVLHTLGVAAGAGTGGGHARFHKDDVYMPITPMFHVHAWGMPYLATMLGVKQVYPGRYEPARLLALIAREGVTFSHCVPTILHMLLACPDAGSVDLARWKVVIGGSAMPRGLAAAARARGIDVSGGYGLSETCPVITLAQLEGGMLEADEDAQLYFRCKAGRPLPLVDLRVVDDDLRELPRDGKSEGEVVVRAPWLTQGYAGNPEGSEALWRGGWLHTGDIGHVDADGYLKVTDRLKDVIKTGGEWVSSILLEDLISHHPAVAEVAVIGVPDERWGERPLALVVPREGDAGAVTPDEIRDHLRHFADEGTIATYAVPDRVVIVDALARTSVGKVDKKRLRAEYGATRA